jgi:hypothetical protein
LRPFEHPPELHVRGPAAPRIQAGVTEGCAIGILVNQVSNWRDFLDCWVC